MYLILALIIIIIWGLNPVIQKALLSKLSPEFVMVSLGIIYFVLLCGYILYKRDLILSDFEKVESKQIFGLLIISILSLSSAILYYYLLSIDTASKLVTLTSIWPLFTILFAKFLLDEPIDLYIPIVLVIFFVIFWNKK